MTDNRQGGFGTKIKINVSGTMTAIVFAQDIEFPEFEKILADITGHDAPDGYDEVIATGKRKMNAFKVKLTWDFTQVTHAAVTAAFNSDNAVQMSVEDPDSIEVLTFMAHVAKLGRVAEQEEGYICDVEIKPTGKLLGGGS